MFTTRPGDKNGMFDPSNMDNNFRLINQPLQLRVDYNFTIFCWNAW